MTDREVSHEHSDNQDETLDVNLRQLSFRLTGALVGKFVLALAPYFGWSMVFLAIAYAIKLVLGEMHNADG